MSGRQRLPGGAPRKASQRKTRRAAPVYRVTPIWRAGDGVRWQGRVGIFRQDIGDGGHAEIVITERIYRVRIKELS